MKTGFLNTMARLAAIVLAATALSVANHSPAQAFGGESLGCRIAPGPELNWGKVCLNYWQSPVYNAGFALLGRSGDGYTFQWHIQGPYRRIITGCTPTRYDCAIEVLGTGTIDREIIVTVDYFQGGQSGRSQANAIINPFCNGQWC